MSQQLLQQRMASELEPINAALATAMGELPSSCRPIASHILHAGGKRLRPLLTVLFARLLGYTRKDIYPLAASMEMLHAATLLHDDVLDNASFRRGKPSAHQVFGAQRAILAGDALLAAGNAIVARFGHPACVLCYSLATSRTAAGEVLEMDSLGNPALPLEDYLHIARGKTAALIAQACALGALAAHASAGQLEAALGFGENLGVAFQIVDDVLDFAPQEQTGKPSGGDLREGKMTPPLKLYRESLEPEKKAEFDKKFSHGAFSLEEAGAIALEVAPFAREARMLAGEYLRHAILSLDQLPDGEEKAILLQMTDYVRDRHH